MLLTVFFNQIISPVYIYSATVFFISFFIIFVALILIYLFYEKRKAARKKILNEIYSNIISEAVLCSEEELKLFIEQPRVKVLKHKWFQDKFARNYLIKEIFKTTESLSGNATQNLKALFVYFELQKDSFKNLQSSKWFKKAKAIQQLAEMQQEQYYKNIYKYTFHQNKYVREEAQIAIVNVAGFQGLRFLDIIRFQVTHWQQLQLINQLGFQPVLKIDKICQWLTSNNNSVIEFALRLVEVYKLYELHDAVLKCRFHKSDDIRMQALQTICTTSNESTADKLIDDYAEATLNEKIYILKILCSIAGKEQLAFLNSQLKHANEQIRYNALKAIVNIDPDYGSWILKSVSSDPSNSFIISTLQFTAE